MTSLSQDKSLAAGLVMHCAHSDSSSLASNAIGIHGSSNVNAGGSRRKLPRTPESNAAAAAATSNSADGNEVLIQSWLDSDRRELTVSIVCARLHRSQSNPCYGQVRILPTPCVHFSLHFFMFALHDRESAAPIRIVVELISFTFIQFNFKIRLVDSTAVKPN